MCNCTLHKNGLILGSVGRSDDADSYQAILQETDDAWVGYAAQTSHVSSSLPSAFRKGQWRCVLRPGDPVLSIHIPVGASFTPTCLDTAIGNARIIVQRSYPEFCCCGFYCHSWLLDPTLHNMIGADSNIAQFAARFARHPVRSNGKEVFGYVFPYGSSTNSNLPETTTLQRKLKRHYLNDGYIYAYVGAFL